MGVPQPKPDQTTQKTGMLRSTHLGGEFPRHQTLSTIDQPEYELPKNQSMEAPSLLTAAIFLSRGWMLKCDGHFRLFWVTWMPEEQSNSFQGMVIIPSLTNRACKPVGTGIHKIWIPWLVVPLNWNTSTETQTPRPSKTNDSNDTKAK